MIEWNGCSRSRGTGAQHPWNAHFTLPDALPHLAAQAIIVIATIANGKQVAILCIKDEQQPIEQYQAGIANVGQGGGRSRLGDCLNELRKNLSEDQIGEVAGNALLVETSLRKRALVKGARIACGPDERSLAENKIEDAQRMGFLGVIERKEAAFMSFELPISGRDLCRRNSPRPSGLLDSKVANGRRW